MNRNTLSLAVAAVMATGTVGAAPFSATDGDYDVFLSGATASAQFVRNAIIDRACDAAGGLSGGDITYYEVDGDDWVVICDLQGTVGASTVRFIKQGGGSGDGTTPISQPAVSPIEYPVPTVASPACTSGPVAATTGTGTPYTSFTDCTIPNVVVNGGDIGTSDVEPALFFDVNTPSTGIAFSAADAAAIDVLPLAGLGFGVGVTTSLRNALQALQFPTASACHPANAQHGLVLPATVDVDGDGVSDDALDVGRIASGNANATPDESESIGTATVADSEACMPNLTSAEIAGIFTGKITNWNQVEREGVDLITAASSAGFTSVAPAPGKVLPASSGLLALNNQRVHLCRRNPGSGTNAQFQAHFLNRPCANVNGTIVAEAALSFNNDECSFLTPSVTCMNRGSSDLGRCLNALENNTTAQALFNNDPDENGEGTTPNPFNNTRYAWGIGYQSVEKNADLARGWRFVKVDGLAPTLQQIAMADYTDHYEQTCQMRKDNSTVDGAANGSEVRDVFTLICGAGPADIFEANQNFLHPFGQTGWLAPPSAGVAPTTIGDLMDPDAPNPVSSWTRGGQSCSAPTVQEDFISTLEGDLP